MWQMIAAAMLSGISARSERRQEEKDNRQTRQSNYRLQQMQADADRQQARIGGDEQRRTLGYGAQLDDYYRKKQRKETSDAWTGYFGPKTVHNNNTAPRLEDWFVQETPLAPYDPNYRG
jgi:hypothetical protein